MKSISFPAVLIILATACSETKEPVDTIDRHALVTRHNVELTVADTLGSLTVGNGEFAFTTDITGLQTFPDHYENGIPLGTQAQWAWHAFPNKEGYSLKDVAEEFSSCDSSKAPYAVQQKDGRRGKATDYLRSNPHRLQLATIGLWMQSKNGNEVKLKDLHLIRQQLDLWTGTITSSFEVDGSSVKVTTFAHQQDDGISATIESPLINSRRLKVRIRFPYPEACHVCDGYQWGFADQHTSTVEMKNEYAASILHTIDSTRYFTNISWNEGTLEAKSKHEFIITPTSDKLEFAVVFEREARLPDPSFDEDREFAIKHWSNFWSTGGAIDFSQCTDPRAAELERRVVLSQYLTKVQCSGSMPPQETGLTMNSWYGKFHLEMYWWHTTHFALWNRINLMSRSLDWYNQALEPARATAAWQGYKGARWQKMTDPSGHESPSNVGAFIIWQQPHPIYMAELMYRQTPDQLILDRYSELVFQTADFMASFVREKEGKFHLCHPLIPAQEIFKAAETDDPAYELQYWRFGLQTAQAWRKRLHLEEQPEWKKIIDRLAELPIKDNLYLPNATTPDAYTDQQYRRDHPSVLAAYGVLPGDGRIDSVVMTNTFNNIIEDWQWETTWGWDYPMIAMTAARLNKPEEAINALLMDTPKNTYLVNGHNFQDKRLRLYLPGNGGLLSAVAMMAAGWDGNKTPAPGFPKNGQWNIKWEGLKPAP